MTFWSPIVGGHQQPFQKVTDHHPKKVTKNCQVHFFSCSDLEVDWSCLRFELPGTLKLTLCNIAPENGWLEDNRCSLLGGKPGLFSGVLWLLVLGRSSFRVEKRFSQWRERYPAITPNRFLDTGHHDYPQQAFQILLDGEADKVLHPERSLLVKGEDLVKVVGCNYPPETPGCNRHHQDYSIFSRESSILGGGETEVVGIQKRGQWFSSSDLYQAHAW